MPKVEIGLIPIPESSRIWRPVCCLDELDDGERGVAALLEVVTRIYVLGVFAEDDEVDLVGIFVGRWDSLEVANRAHARVQIEVLPETHIDRSEAWTHAVVMTAVVAGAAVVLLVGAVETDVGLLADRGGEGTLDGDLEVPDGVYRFLGELGSVVLEPFETGVERAPGELAGTAIALFDRGIHHFLHHRGDIEADSVSAEGTDDRPIADDELAVN